MQNRWLVLALLFAVRLTMAFQFQSVAAVAPLLEHAFGVGFADIGVLIGLYFTPGIALALPGGAIGQRFGDQRTVHAALLLMLVGELAMASSTAWSIQIAGRLVSGAGGVMLNVQMTKMVADWFAGQEIATAMAIFVNSWPAGIALSLITLSLVGAAFGVSAVYLSVAACIGLALVAFVAFYRPPANEPTSAAVSSWPDRHVLTAVIVAGLIWGLFNVGFAMIFSFGPSMLTERGWSVSSAGSLISIVLWLALVSVPLGGFLADRSRRPGLVLTLGCVLSTMTMIALPRSETVILLIILLGLISGLPVGPIMSLPAQVLGPQTRSFGMGIFYTLYYGTMMLGPVVAGACANWTGNLASALDFGAATFFACPVLLWGFLRLPKAISNAG